MHFYVQKTAIYFPTTKHCITNCLQDHVYETYTVCLLSACLLQGRGGGNSLWASHGFKRLSTSFSKILFKVGVNDTPRQEPTKFLGLCFPLYNGMITLYFRTSGTCLILLLYKSVKCSYSLYP